MNIKMRHIEDIESVDFCDICAPFSSELEKLIEFIKQSGGVYCKTSSVEPFHSYQLVLRNGEAFVEILVGEDEEE